MLYDTYVLLKKRLQDLNMPTEWYNVQYEETMINDAGFFFEFPDELKFENVSKEMRRAPIKIRLHVYSNALRTTDGIPDAAVVAHESLALQALALLDGFTPVADDGQRVTSRLQLVSWKHWHRWRGWMVTFVEFEAKKVL